MEYTLTTHLLDEHHPRVVVDGDGPELERGEEPAHRVGGRQAFTDDDGLRAWDE